MALSLDLKKEDNHMYIDFKDAYWVIKEIAYNTELASFRLVCYPNRESSKMYLTEPASTFRYGGMTQPTYEPSLREWDGIAKIEEIFPSGIPLGSNAQKTAIYNWIKSYTGLPFEDVFEEDQA